VNRGFCQALCMSVAGTLLSACGSGSQPTFGAPGMPQSRSIAQPQERHPSGSTGDLLYAVETYDLKVWVMTYPDHQQLGELHFSGTPSWVCSDANGNVWVTNAAGPEVYEYSHGKLRPKAKVRLEGYTSGKGCSVSPLTGDLAVDVGQNIVIFNHARGRGIAHPVPFESSDCAYDGSGNLFTLGSSGPIQIAELQQGASGFEDITLDKHAEADSSGAINWDGKYMTVGVSTEGRRLIYRFKVQGTTGRVVGVVHLAEEQKGAQYWVTGKTIVSELRGWDDMGVWDYPRGGRAGLIINIGPFGSLTVSIAHNHPAGSKAAPRVEPEADLTMLERSTDARPAGR
jgi:hypothetical protein